MSSFLSTILCCIFHVSFQTQLSYPDAFELRNQTVTITKEVNNFYIFGYKGAFGPYTSIDMTVQGQASAALKLACSGSFSCQSMSTLHVNRDDTILNCQGTNACSNMTILSETTATEFHCYAHNSCMFSVLEDTVSESNIVDCFGEASCAYTNMKSIERIRGTGAYSLSKATIDSQNIISSLNIDLYGKLAGYGATLTCRNGDTCNINCRSYDSCYMFYVQCDGTCNIVSDDVIAPITNPAQVGTIDLRNNDNLCNTNPSAITFDDFLERQLDIVINDPTETHICCRATQSCRDINEIKYISATTSSIICSGQYSCGSSNFDANNAEIYCEGADSCKDNVQIVDASRVYCLGYRSCVDSNIISSRYILCSAMESCANAMIYSAGVDLNVEFTGDISGDNAEIYCNGTDTCNVVCSGMNACLSTTVTCFGTCTAQCDASSGCPLDLGPSPIEFGTSYPSKAPNQTPPSSSPTLHPTLHPSVDPTLYPTLFPTLYPTLAPTSHPSLYPTLHPSLYPTSYPSSYPTLYPSLYPTLHPSSYPTLSPTTVPTPSPTIQEAEQKDKTTQNNEESFDESMNDNEGYMLSFSTLMIFGGGLVLVALFVCFGCGYMWCKNRKLKAVVAENMVTCGLESASDNNTDETKLGGDSNNNTDGTELEMAYTMNIVGVSAIEMQPGAAKAPTINVSKDCDSKDNDSDTADEELYTYDEKPTTTQGEYETDGKTSTGGYGETAGEISSS